MEQNINQWVHNLVVQHIKPEDVVLDCTCGNGHDTVFLAKHAALVHAFDIQEVAIQHTQKAVLEAGQENVIYHLSSHDQVDAQCPDTIFNIAMYNLGYLPTGDHRIITAKETTIPSIKQVLIQLAVGGLITITLYIGHPGGEDEASAISDYVSTLDKRDYTITKFQYINRKKSPYVIAIEKIR